MASSTIKRIHPNGGLHVPHNVHQDLVTQGLALRVISDNATNDDDQLFLTKKGLIERAEMEEDTPEPEPTPTPHYSEELELNDPFAQVQGD